MLRTYLLCVFVLVATAGTSAKENEQFEEIDSITPEIPCSAAGGTCTVAADCSPDQRAPDGLCPQQQRRGVECCYGISVHETRCRRRGGECVSSSNRCPDQLIFAEATDCGDDEKCCMLI